ncbi:SDR family oxidoreductase [Microbacteriaceae bacterium VKM Ac-2854]|nr:SDR family oxidoreductase [Microbacteriaceae bacterium VKM Ac-2854]
MNVVVLGGAGRTGSLVARVARKAGHEVTLLVRDASRVADGAGLRILSGDATDGAAIARALKGQDGLISTLGSHSMLRSDIARPAATQFVPIAEAERLRRVIVMSAFGVGATADQATTAVRTAFATVLRSLYRDKTAGDDIVRRSTLDWTIVHPVTLTDGAGTGRFTATERLTSGRGRTISRADVAEFLVASLVSPEWSRRTVVVAS